MSSSDDSHHTLTKRRFLTRTIKSLLFMLTADLSIEMLVLKNQRSRGEFEIYIFFYVVFSRERLFIFLAEPIKLGPACCLLEVESVNAIDSIHTGGG